MMYIVKIDPKMVPNASKEPVAIITAKSEAEAITSTALKYGMNQCLLMAIPK